MATWPVHSEHRKVPFFMPPPTSLRQPGVSRSAGGRGSNVTVAVVQRWWRVDDWFRPVDADGTPNGRSRHAKSYDTEPPFWFRYAGYLTLLLFLPVNFGIAYRDRRAIALGLVLTVAFGIAVILWERRHRVRTVAGDAPQAVG